MSAAELLTTYGELAEVIDHLPLLTRERRRQRRLSLRSAAVEVGVSAATLSRLENGRDLDGRNLAAVLRWLDAPHSPAEPVSPVSTPTEAHGETGEAQEG